MCDLAGGMLPPPQAELEEKYHEELDANFGVVFNELFAFTNFPIKRFADFLIRRWVSYILSTYISSTVYYNNNYSNL